MESLGRCPNLLAFCKQQEKKFAQTHVHGVCKMLRLQWQRNAICPKASFVVRGQCTKGFDITSSFFVRMNYFVAYIFGMLNFSNSKAY